MQDPLTHRELGRVSSLFVTKPEDPGGRLLRRRGWTAGDLGARRCSRSGDLNRYGQEAGEQLGSFNKATHGSCEQCWNSVVLVGCPAPSTPIN